MNKKFFIAFLLTAIFFVFSTGCSSTPKKETSVQQLIKEGNKEEAKARFTTKYDINEIDEDGNTALHIAASMNDADLVTFLIIKNADIELKNYKSQTPLHVAVEHNAVDAARALVSFGANIFARDEEGNMAIDMAFARGSAYYDIFITTKTGELRDSEDGRSIVHYFVQTKNNAAINCCVRKDIPLSIADASGRTPLDLVFELLSDINSVEIAANLIQNGAEPVESEYDYFQTAVLSRNLDYRFDDGQTPLHLASIAGHTPVVSYLLRNNAQTDVQDSSGATPLHEAVRYGQTEIASLLLQSKANPNAKDNLGKTPLLLIIPEKQREQLYPLLISQGADVSIKDMYGDTVMHTATMTKVSADILKQIVAAGADINARNKEGVTPLAIAIKNNITEHILFYADNNADIHIKDTKGQTPLTMALKSDDAVLEIIVNKNNVTSHDSDGNTPLNVAIINNASLLKIQYILSLTDDVNTRNADGNTALYLAVLKNRRKVGEMLLAKNADIFATNTKNRSPLSLALNAGGSVMDWLLTSQTIAATDGSGNTALHYAAEWGLTDAISAIIQKGAHTEAKNANGETPIFSACKNDNPAVAAQLVSQGAHLNARDNLGSTPLHTAVRWGNINTALKLIALGIDVNSQNISGKSPLAEAVIAGKYDMAKMLLDKGANPDISDTAGRTVLIDAIRSKNSRIIQLLLAYNANPQIQEINGRNAYHEAVLSGDKQIITLIRDAGGNPLSRDKNGITPFSLSLRENDDSISAVLGKNTTITDSDGNSPVHIVIKNNCPLRTLSMLLSAGYPVDTRNADGYTPLGIAIEANNREYAATLLANGANPFIMIDKKGRNPAVIAIEKQNDAILGDIAKYAGKMADIQGNTILHYAAHSASAETIQKLLSFGLDTSVRNISGETPYITALRWKRTDIAHLLQSSADAK